MTSNHPNPSHHSNSGTISENPLYPWILLSLGLLGVVAYHFPWHTHPVAAFTNNAFDLAEFASLHPATRAENPALLSSILLRLPLVLLAGNIALAAGRLRDERLRWIWRGVALLVALRLNPPVEFYRNPTGVSLNDQHLAALTAAGILLVVSVVIFNTWLQRIHYGLQIALWGGLAVTSWEGLRRATTTIESLQIDVEYGAGIYVMLALAALAIGFSGWRFIVLRRNRQSQAA